MEAPAVLYNDLQHKETSETSAQIKARVLQTIAIQRTRFKDSDTRANANMTAKQIEQHCALGEQEQRILKKAFDRLKLSGRAYHKILKVARTIADLENVEQINVPHLAEAIQYRSLDRKYWGV